MKLRAVLILIFAAAAACGACAQVKAVDGVYFAEDIGYATEGGWKEQVVLTVAAGKITRVVWNGVSNLGLPDRKTVAAAGGYGMKKASKLGLEWDKEAAAVEEYLLKSQDPAFDRFKQDGTTDAISGASLHVWIFYDLVRKALARGVVPRGIYRKDGWYFKEQADYDKDAGWKESVLITVVNGTIVDVIWNALNKSPQLKSKLVEAQSGRYNMGKTARRGEWNVQAAAVQRAILKAQDPATIHVKADGTTDAISGASIRVTAVGLAIEALKEAR